MVKSQRSSTTLFHQWPNNNNRNQSLPPTPTTPHHGNTNSNNSYGNVNSNINGNGNTQSGITSNRANANTSTGVGVGLKYPNPSNPNPNANASTPGSPSQIDPFGSQVTCNSTSPIPLQHSSSNSNPVIIKSRPPSTVLSSGGSPLPGTKNTVVTPKIILASPSTSTIHYLFPSSDTKNGIHLSTTSASGITQNSSTSLTQEVKTNQVDGKLKRGQALSRGNSIKHKKDHNSNTEQSHREIPGLKNKRSLPTPLLQQQIENQPQSTQSKKTQIVNTPAIGLGVKKSDISKPIPSESDEARDYSKGYYDVGPGSEIDAKNMGTLRRQPGMIDLSGKVKVGITEKSENMHNNAGGVKRRESIILKEIENRRERKGWEIGSKPTNSNDPVNHPASSTKTSTNISRSQIRGPTQRPYIPPITVIQQRRRSQSLTSPRPAPSPPIDPQKSPLLPAPDLGDPLSLSVVIPSPSYSHLDYSPAGSSASSLSRSQSKKLGWGKRTSAIFPLSVAMSRGDTRKGLGTYDSAKLKAKEDYEQRMNWNNNNNGIGRFGSIKRSLSLKKKNNDDEESVRRFRPRSQSLTTTKSFRGLEEAPPLPSPSLMRGGYTPYNYENTSSAYTGELSIDLGSRYHPHQQENGSYTTLELDLASPRSAETSVFPASTPTESEFDSNGGDNLIRIVGKPLHPAFNGQNGSDSELSILAPSTIGLGFSPIGTPISLPGSLLDEMIDLTETGSRFANADRRLSSPMVESVITPPTPQNNGILPSPALLDPRDNSTTDTGSSLGGQKQKIPRRSLLLAQNRFYIRPSHPKPPIVTPDQNQGNMQKKPSLRSSKSLGPGIMKRAYTSGNLKADASGQPSPMINQNPSPTPSNSTSFGRGLLKSASIRSTTRRFSKILENTEANQDSTTHHQQQHYGTERISSTSSMRFHRRPLTTFSLCSPSDAIEPLPHNASPSITVDQATRSESKTLRSNKSSPFLSASNSLRVIFGKEGFVVRSLSQAFEKDHHDHSDQFQRRERERESSSSPNPNEELKLKISSPLEASSSSFPTRSTSSRNSKFKQTDSVRRTSKNRDRERTLSPEFEEEAREIGRNADKKWRQSVLQEALTFSISNSSSLNKLADLGGGGVNANEEGKLINDTSIPRMVSSGSKSRLAIPDKLLSAPEIQENRQSVISNQSEVYKGIGQNMLNLNTNNSLESSLNLRAVMEDWNLPPSANDNHTNMGNTRLLGLVGKEESMMSAPSMYSNNASTLFEKPTRRLQGKGLPSSFSIAELNKTSYSVSGGKIKDSNSKIRMISPPIPISSPLTYNDNIHTFDLRQQSQDERKEEWIDNMNMVDTQKSMGRNLSTRSSLFGLRSKSKAQYTTEPINNSNINNSNINKTMPRSISPISSYTNHYESKSNFGLSVKSSLKNGKSRSTSYNNNGISSNDSHVNPQNELPVLDSLLARDEPTPSLTITRNDDNSNKLRKVLEWRDEVGENEQLARLEQKIRGFVSDDRERVRDIGRKSIEG